MAQILEPITKINNATPDNLVKVANKCANGKLTKAQQASLRSIIKSKQDEHEQIVEETDSDNEDEHDTSLLGKQRNKKKEKAVAKPVAKKRPAIGDLSSLNSSAIGSENIKDFAEMTEQINFIISWYGVNKDLPIRNFITSLFTNAPMLQEIKAGTCINDLVRDNCGTLIAKLLEEKKTSPNYSQWESWLANLLVTLKAMTYPRAIIQTIKKNDDLSQIGDEIFPAIEIANEMQVENK